MGLSPQHKPYKVYTMNTIKLTILSTAVVSSFAMATIKSDGDLHDGGQLGFTMDNSLVCGVQIGDGNLSTGSAELHTGNINAGINTKGIRKVKFISNDGDRELDVDVTLTLDPKLTGNAADTSHYQLLNYSNNTGNNSGTDITFTQPTVSHKYRTTKDSAYSNGYDLVLHTTLSAAELPYGNINNTVTMTVNCN